MEEAGLKCIGVNTRSKQSYERFSTFLQKRQLNLKELTAAADLVFITTQDAIIKDIAEKLTKERLYKEGQVWIHCSGSQPSAIMCRKPGIPVGFLSVHPLQAFADIETALSLIEGTHFGLEGDSPQTEELGEAIVQVLGGIPHKIDPEQKTIYHAGAVAASNYLVALASLAVKLFNQAGINREDALASILPLIAGSYQNIAKVGLPQALTGPIARGEVEVIEKHLKEIPLDLQEIYKGLGMLALELGKEKKEINGDNYKEETLRKMQQLLSSG